MDKQTVIERIAITLATDDSRCPHCGETSDARKQPADGYRLFLCLACYTLWRMGTVRELWTPVV